ncbi:hypothetical protein FE257_004241 [Aspergillus nanangensis]|uniref:Microbial-type PARG catalytic domain-containing protein n=1 Tax=Aspergillus nanangensis TaxID=2582783 RepID=A0AAD4GW72_ASPNN|nr:hypothetical protein FE257_004241 [Aspergillus nanangensis]
MMSLLRDLVAGYNPRTPQPSQHHRPTNTTHHDAEALRRREILKRTAVETNSVLPSLLQQLNCVREAQTSRKHSIKSLRSVNRNSCPSFPSRAVIEVVNDDTLNAAIQLFHSERSANIDPRLKNPRPFIVNFANNRKPGGGWLNGAMAQEEAICYRSSLAMSLYAEDYPLALDEAIYSPCVVVIRNDMASGHELLLGNTSPENLPVVSAMTVAAICRPQIRTVMVKEKSRSRSASVRAVHPREKQVFARRKDREVTMMKMRLVLRVAASKGHGLLVLGALGCGVYGNPPEDVAECWLKVLREDEFRGRWWKRVCFAVYDPRNEGNYAAFHRVLSGKRV